MTRNPKTLGLALAAALALSAVAASAASASPALFTANVTANEFAEIHGEQVGTDTFTIGVMSPMTCTTARETGFAESSEVHIKGGSATYVTLAPTYETCHIVIGGILTRTITVTTNGCYYTFNATKNTASTPWSADLHIRCPANQKIEIHVYSTSNHNDAGGATLCTYDVTPQTILNQIQLTNEPNGPGPDDILAHINMTFQAHNLMKNATCGNNAVETFVYQGTHTLRATNEAKQFVNTTIS